MRAHTTRRYWLCGMVLALLQYTLLLRLSYVHYALPDDIELARALAGYWGGVPVPFAANIHTLLAFPLAWLYGAMPTVPWFGVVQALMLLFASTLATKALIQLMARCHRPPWLGIPLSLLFWGAFLMEGSTTVTYTVTAAILSSAGIFQLFAVDLSLPQGRARGLALSLVPLVLGYLLRQVASLPAAAMWLASLLARLCLLPPETRNAALRPLGRFCLMAALLFAGLMLLREADITLQNQRDFTRWQRARIQLTDYDDSARLTADDLATVGWSPAELALYRTWYFWDANMDAAALNALHQRHEALPAADAVDPLRRVWRAWLRLDATSEAFAHWWLAALLLAALCWLALLPTRLRRTIAMAAPLLILLAAAALLAYLALAGRFPRRAAASVLFPALAALYALACTLMPRGWHARNLAPAAAALLCAAVMGSTAYTAWRYCFNPTTYNFTTPTAAEVQYAAAHPAQLLFVDSTVPLPTAMFAAVPRTANLLPLQSWNSRAPGMLATLTAFGLDGLDFSITALLREDVRLISAEPAAQSELLAYLSERAGTPVAASLDARAGSLYVLRLHTVPSASAP